MKTPLLIVLLTSAALLGACAKPEAEGASAPPPSGATAPTADAARTGSATGTVQAVDAAAGTITLEHGPVAALGWPGMTMAFKASPAQIAAVKPGDRVDFEFEATGAQATITRIDAR